VKRDERGGSSGLVGGKVKGRNREGPLKREFRVKRERGGD
jgi:hypothetical protein